MKWSEWLERIHPVRAILAISALGATIWFLRAGVAMTDGWWIIVTALCLFYVEALKNNPPKAG